MNWAVMLHIAVSVHHDYVATELSDAVWLMQVYDGADMFDIQRSLHHSSVHRIRQWNTLLDGRLYVPVMCHVSYVSVSMVCLGQWLLLIERPTNVPDIVFVCICHSAVGQTWVATNRSLQL